MKKGFKSFAVLVLLLLLGIIGYMAIDKFELASTEVPTATPMPESTAMPTPAPEVTPTVVPTATPVVEVTHTPAPTEVPEIIVTVAPTEEPEITITVEPLEPDTVIITTPEPTVEPTEVPAPTEVPEVTVAPTETPVPTEEPKEEEVITVTAIPTEAPKTTATPVPTKKPEPTATPKPTKKPEPTATPTPKATGNLESWQTHADKASDKLEFCNYRIEYNWLGEEVRIETGGNTDAVEVLAKKYNLPIKNGVYSSNANFFADWEAWMDLNGRNEGNDLYYDMDGNIVYELGDKGLRICDTYYDDDYNLCYEFVTELSEDGTMFYSREAEEWVKIPEMTDNVEEISHYIAECAADKDWERTYGHLEVGEIVFGRDSFNRATDYYNSGSLQYKVSETRMESFKVTKHFTIDLLYFWEVLGYGDYFDTVEEWKIAATELNAVLTAWNEIVTSTEFYALEGKYEVSPENVMRGNCSDKLSKAYESHCAVREDFWNEYNQ